MLSTLLLMTLTLALSGAVPPASPEARREAAVMIRDTLTVLQAQDVARHRVSGLLAAGEAAADVLGESLLAGELSGAVAEARSRAAEDPGAAATRLEDSLRRVLADLQFEPILEAGLPEGFPAPTPVGEIELKPYPRYRVARAGASRSAAFWQLFTHIKKHAIPMTAPVEMTYDAQGDEIAMAFMYEHAAQGSVGQDGTVEVLDVEPMLVASIGCRGWASDAAVSEAHARLTAWIADQGDLTIAGPTRQFGYNSPSVPASRKYFEVQIPVRKLSAEPPAAELPADVPATRAGGAEGGAG